MLVSTVQQSESTIHTYIYTYSFFLISFPFKSQPSTEFPELSSYILISNLLYTSCQ